MFNRVCVSNKAYTTSRDYKNLDYIIYFNFDKKTYYASTCIIT